MMDTKFLFGNVIIPLCHYARLDFRYLYLRDYIANLKKTRAEIAALRNRKLQALIRHAYETVPYYNSLFRRYDIKPESIRQPNDLRRIPILTKDLVNVNAAGLRSKKRYRLIEVTSGGSTGNRVAVMKDKRYHEISRAVALRDLYSAGIRPGEKVAWVWGSQIDNQPLKESIARRLQWYLNRRILFNAFRYSDHETRKWLTADLPRSGSEYIYGYATTLYDMACVIHRHGIKIHGIRKIISSAQRLEHREFIEKAFGCRVLDHYGSREIESIAIEDDSYIMHSSDDFVIAELDGDSRILLTPLESYGMPLIRYANGDIGKKRASAARINHPFSEFSLCIGRECEVLRNRQGEKVYSGRINTLIAKKKLDIGEFQLVQMTYDEAILNIVDRKRRAGDDVDRLKGLIREILGCSTIRVNYLKDYPVEQSGKKIGYKCLIKDENPNN